MLTALMYVAILYSLVQLVGQMHRRAIDDSLMSAIHYGTIADVGRALAAGADVNSHEGYGTTPVMLASFYGRVDIVELLLKRGANPNFVCPRGETALKWATQNKHDVVARLLRQAGESE